MTTEKKGLTTGRGYVMTMGNTYNVTATRKQKERLLEKLIADSLSS